MNNPQQIVKKERHESHDELEVENAMRNFRFIATNVGVPFVENSQCTPVEQICILDKVNEIWKYEAPGFLGLVIQAHHALIFSRNNDVFLNGDEFLSLNEDELSEYCNQHKLSKADRARVRQRF